MKFVIVLAAFLAVAVAKPQYPGYGAPISNVAKQNSNAVASGPGSTAISKGTANANLQIPAGPAYPGPYPGPYPPPGPYPAGPIANEANQASNAAANGPGSTAISEGTSNANLGLGK